VPWFMSEKELEKKELKKFFEHAMVEHGEDSKDPNGSINSRVQEKNITYPTDSKLQEKIIDNCVKTTKQEGIVLRRSYKRTAKQLVRDTYNGGHPKRRKKANAAKRK
jgi:IS5 family transposase